LVGLYKKPCVAVGKGKRERNRDGDPYCAFLFYLFHYALSLIDEIGGVEGEE